MSDGIDVLEQMVERLTAENGRLRAEVVRLDEQTEDALHQATQAAYFSRNYSKERDALRLDLARVTEQLVDAGALHLADEQSVRNMERVIEGLLAERDGLLKAARQVLAADHYQEDDNGIEYGSEQLAPLRLAVAACATEVKP